MNQLYNRGLVLALLLALPAALHAQETDTYQPDSVMRAHRVRTKTRRHSNSLSQAREVWEYDQQGRLSSYYLTDNVDPDKRQFTIRYAYGPTGRLLRETYQSHDEPTRTTEYSYAPNGDYRAVERQGRKKVIVREKEFRADSARLTARQLDEGQAYRTNISYFERPLVTRRFAGSEAEQSAGPQTLTVNGQTFTMASSASRWCYDFRNRYDAQGRLLERTRTESGQQKDRSTYTYDPAGLLTEKATTLYLGASGPATRREQYTYTFW
jgi:RHS Repeat